MKNKFSLVSVITLGVAALFAATLAPVTSNASDGGQYTANAWVSTFTNAASGVAYTAPTNQFNWSIGVLRQRSINVQADIYDDAATSTTYTLAYRFSTDGVSYGPILGTNIVCAAAGKTTVIIPLSLQGNGYVNFPYITNASATVNCTNGTIRIPLNYNAP